MRNSSRPIESGTDELKKRHSVVIDDLDPRGIFQRARVEDQCEIDRLFVRRDITAPQHGAAELFLDACQDSGMFPKSCSLEASIGNPLYKVGTILAMRRIAFSRPYRKMEEKSKAGADFVLRIVVSNERRRVNWDIDVALDALVEWYGTGSLEDPRRG
jgi:hypothetical protein